MERFAPPPDEDGEGDEDEDDEEEHADWKPYQACENTYRDNRPTSIQGFFNSHTGKIANIICNPRTTSDSRGCSCGTLKLRTIPSWPG